MLYEELLNKVQERAFFNTRHEAVGALRATLQTLGERLDLPATVELAGHLPDEVSKYLLLNLELPVARPSVTSFFRRIALREGVNLGQAVYHACAIVEVLREAFYTRKTPRHNPFADDITPLFEHAVMGRAWNEVNSRTAA